MEQRSTVIINDDGKMRTILLTDDQIRLLKWLQDKNWFYEEVQFEVIGKEAVPEII